MTVPIGGNIFYPPAGGDKRDIENSLWLKLGFHVILAEDPEELRTVRVYSTANGDELVALNGALREFLPAHLAFHVNDPALLLEHFISTSRDALALITKCRKWRRAAYVAPLLGAVIAIMAQIIWTLVTQ